MGEKMTQTQSILSHLKKGKTITPLLALKKFNCFRLAARINNLRDEGHSIKTTIKKINKKRFASYKLV